MSDRRLSTPVGSVAVLVLLAIGSSGCNYTFQAGSGLPSHVRTLAVVPFDNDTGRFELSQEIHQALLDELPRTFRVRTAGEGVADAVVRGSIRRYSVDAPSYRPGAAGAATEVIERQVNVTVQVEIVDRVNNVILWESTSLGGRGEYLEASQLEEDGRRLAIERIVQGIVDGLQSNW